MKPEEKDRTEVLNASMEEVELREKQVSVKENTINELELKLAAKEKVVQVGARRLGWRAL
jgi:hypothetical protein